MNVKLGIEERLKVLGLLPVEGNLVTMRVLSELRKDLGFSEIEITEWSIESDVETGRVSWDMDAEQAKTINIGVAALSLIKETVARLDTENKITDGHLAIIEKLEL